MLYLAFQFEFVCHILIICRCPVMFIINFFCGFSISLCAFINGTDSQPCLLKNSNEDVHIFSIHVVHHRTEI